MNKATIIQTILDGRSLEPVRESGHAFKPSNIALCKYWGKRDRVLNLPVTSSLSISLNDKGSKTKISIIEKSSLEKPSLEKSNFEKLNSDKSKSDLADNFNSKDKIAQNILEKNTFEKDIIEIKNNSLASQSQSKFNQKIIEFLDHFRGPQNHFFHIETESNIPIGAGLASSASGFAALVGALDHLFNWQLPESNLSLLARLGSGSASRSFWQGFVQWHKGDRDDGLDSFAERLPYEWPELRIGLLICDESEKALSSREAMERTRLTSPFYSLWPALVEKNLEELKEAIATQNFSLFGKTAETNAIAMHATLQTAWPPICYSQSQTIDWMNQIWKLRHQGLEIYFTQDAGPNLKLLFLKKDSDLIRSLFKVVEIIDPFQSTLLFPEKKESSLC